MFARKPKNAIEEAEKARHNAACESLSDEAEEWGSNTGGVIFAIAISILVVGVFLMFLFPSGIR